MKQRREPDRVTHEIEQETATAWLASGVITVVEQGEENTYYTDDFGTRFYCKWDPKAINTVRLDTLRNGDHIVSECGLKALWVTTSLIASGDVEDLPDGDWRGVSVRQAQEIVETAIMSSFTFNHLLAWVANTIRFEDRRDTFDRIYAFVREFPVVVERGDSWPEILRLVEREGA